MTHTVLDLRSISTVDALQIYLQYQLRFPDWYGRNLDALHDLLTERSRPLHLKVITGSSPSKEIKQYLPRLRRVFKDCARENPAFTWEETVE